MALTPQEIHAKNSRQVAANGTTRQRFLTFDQIVTDYDA